MHSSQPRSRLTATAVSVATVAALSLAVPAAASDAADPPFEVTEKQRPRCDNYEPNRQALFGTTHLHTGLSFDASIRFVDYHAGNNPRGAYEFAKGGHKIRLPDPSGLQTRTRQIDRALDWGAVTDHSEHFGEMGFCKDLLEEPVSERLSMECRMINGFFYEPLHALNPVLGRTLASNAFTSLTMTSLGASSKNTHLPVCENNPELCKRSELVVWEEIQQAAEDHYDRTSDCSFTTFIAYENTSTPLLNNWHRNVIFRNANVVTRPVTAIDMAVVVNPSPTTGGPKGVGEPVNSIGGVVREDDPEEAYRISAGPEGVGEPVDSIDGVAPGEGSTPEVAEISAAARIWPAPPGAYSHPLPQPFWNKLEYDCTEGHNVTGGDGSRCDFITIPHNSNLGGGSGLIPPLFLSPYNTADAKRHAQMEPLVEIYQDKGSSECRYDPRYLSGTGTIDEFCAFEILDGKTLGSASGVGSSTDSVAAPDTWNGRAYVRNVWKDGIRYAAQYTFEGVNPFKMGVVAASDSHTGVMGWHPETAEWPGHLGIDDIYPMARASTIQNSTGGHSVVWAEENSRDSIFEALRRKETYGTSGTRPIVRFFGGWDFTAEDCQHDFVERGYRHGVPMGGDLPLRVGNGAPRFIAAAWRDDVIKTNLQQIQIVKGWVNGLGETEERVYSVAGDPGNPLNPATAIDPLTCAARKDLGHLRLCTVWEDPYFNPEQHAFYYVRVLEEPVCRYSTLWCQKNIGVNPLNNAECVEKLTLMASGKFGLTEEERVEAQLKAAQGAMCCSDQTTVPFVQPVIQERAWTSPIWYDPNDVEAVATEAEPTEADPAEAEPAEAEPAEAEPTEADPPEADPADPAS